MLPAVVPQTSAAGSACAAPGTSPLSESEPNRSCIVGLEGFAVSCSSAASASLSRPTPL